MRISHGLRIKIYYIIIARNIKLQLMILCKDTYRS